MTVEVFDSLASSQGLQKSGWFAKIVKDKFNIKLNIICLLYTSPSPRDS